MQIPYKIRIADIRIQEYHVSKNDSIISNESTLSHIVNLYSDSAVYVVHQHRWVWKDIQIFPVQYTIYICNIILIHLMASLPALCKTKSAIPLGPTCQVVIPVWNWSASYYITILTDNINFIAHQSVGHYNLQG